MTLKKPYVLEKLDTLTSDLADMKTKYKNRMFKPKFSVSCYWGQNNDYNGTIWNATRTAIDNDIDIWSKHYVDEITLIIHISYNASNNTFYVCENLDDFEYAVGKIEENGMSVGAIKLHNNFDSTHISTYGMSAWQTAWKGFITSIGTRFQPYDIPILTVMNEFPYIYADAGAAYDTFVVECLNLAKGMGYQTGISTAGAEQSFLLRSTILNAVDYVCINTYPYITAKKNDATLQDGIIGWQSQNILSYIYAIKKQYPNMKFIISESGVQDYMVALTKPERYTWAGGDMVSSSGKAQSIFLLGLLEYLNNEIIENVWWWYSFGDNELTKGMLRQYLGGLSYELS